MTLSTPEPAPIHNDKPAVWDLVIADMRHAMTFTSITVTPEAGPRGALTGAYRDALRMIATLREAIGPAPATGRYEVVREEPTRRQLVPLWDDRVLADMAERDATGRAKYGTPLQPFNGRNALVDAYQEALDLAVYLRQALYERDGR